MNPLFKFDFDRGNIERTLHRPTTATLSGPSVFFSLDQCERQSRIDWVPSASATARAAFFPLACAGVEEEEGGVGRKAVAERKRSVGCSERNEAAQVAKDSRGHVSTERQTFSVEWLVDEGSTYQFCSRRRATSSQPFAQYSPDAHFGTPTDPSRPELR